MYAGESAVYLEGLFLSARGQGPKLLPIPANEHLPELLVEGSITLRSALNVHTLLRQMIRDLNGKHVPGHIASVVRQTSLRSVRDIDTSWAHSLVSQFHDVSQPLGLGMEEESFVVQMEQALLDSLQDDIANEALYFTPYRVAAVHDAMKTIGTGFTRSHADKVSEWVYERFTDALRLPGDDSLQETMENTDRIISRVEHIFRYG